MKKYCYIFTFVILMAILFSACQPSATETQSAAETGSEAVAEDTGEDAAEVVEEESSSGPVEVTLWHVLVGPHEEAFNKLVEEFNAGHPDIVIVPEFGGDFTALHQKVMASLTAGEPPVMAMSSGPSMTAEYIKADAIVPVETFINDPEIGLDEDSLNDVFPGFISEATHDIDGVPTIVSWPFTKSITVLYYRQDHIEEAGLEGPPQTWQEFREDAQILTDQIGSPAFQWTPDASIFTAMARSYGCELISEDNTQALFNGEGCVEALQLLTDMALVDKTFAITSGYDHQNEMIAGRSSMFLQTTVSRVFLDQTVPFGLAALPKAEKEVATLFGPNAVIFNESTEAEQKAAWEFLKWFTDSDQTGRWSLETGFVPVRASAGEADTYRAAVEADPLRLAVGLETLPIAVPMPGAAGWVRAEEALNDAIMKALTGVATPEEALNEAAEIANKALQK